MDSKKNPHHYVDVKFKAYFIFASDFVSPHDLSPFEAPKNLKCSSWDLCYFVILFDIAFDIAVDSDAQRPLQRNDKQCG